MSFKQSKKKKHKDKLPEMIKYIQTGWSFRWKIKLFLLYVSLEKQNL